MDETQKKELMHVCYTFGGATYFGSDYWRHDTFGVYCYMGLSDLQAATDSNTCEELKGDFNPDRTQCRIPMENVTQLRRRKHPKYYDDSLDQLAYELLVEESQSYAIFNEEKNKKDPDAERKRLEIFKEHPIATMGVIRRTIDENGKPKIEAMKIKDIYVNEKMAKRFWDSLDLMFIESHAKDRFAQIVHHDFYYNLPKNEQAKIRYRMNKHTKEFKL